MKNLKKVICTLLTCAICITPLTATVSAQDLVDPENINSIANYFGIDLSDPESVQNAINNIQNGGISGLMSILGIDASDIIDELQAYAENMDVVTTAPVSTAPATTETTTEETTQAVITTVVEKPVYIPVTQKPTEAATAETTTEEETTEEQGEEAQTTTVQSIESIGTEIPQTTIFVIISTVAVFIAGLATGIGITKYMSGKDRKKEE